MSTTDLVKYLERVANELYRAATRRDTEALRRMLEELETTCKQHGLISDIALLSHRLYNTITAVLADISTDPLAIAAAFIDIYTEYGLREVLASYLRKIVLSEPGVVVDQDKSTFCYVLATAIIKLMAAANSLTIIEPLAGKFMNEAHRVALFTTVRETVRATVCKLATLYCTFCSEMFDVCLETLCPIARDRLR